jgi:hypothetical protein
VIRLLDGEEVHGAENDKLTIGVDVGDTTGQRACGAAAPDRLPEVAISRAVTATS